MKENKTLSKSLPISEYQKRFFLEWVLAPYDTTYNTSLVNKITGNFDEKALKQACEVFIRQNELAHARYSHDGFTCYYGNYDISDFYHESALDLNQSVDSQLRAVLEIPFDLTKDVLLRFQLIKNYESSTPECYFIICAHHIIADAICAFQLTKKIQETYNLLINGADVLFEVDNSFLQAINVETQTLNEDYKGKAQKFWLDFIDSSLPELNLPYRSNVDPINFDDRLSDKSGEFFYFDLTPEQTAQLKAYAKQNRTTVFIVLSAIYGLVLSKYCNQKKIILSYPVSMRPKGFNNVLGCFVNNLPLILDFNNTATIEDVLKSLNEQRKEVKPYQGYSLIDIIQDQRKLNHNDLSKLLRIGFVQANLNTTIIDLDGVVVSPVDISSSEKIDFEITLLYDEYSSHLVKFKFEYRKALFDKELMHRFIGSFKSSISKILNGNEILVNTFSVLSPDEYNQIVYQWNATDNGYPKDKTIQQLFEEQVAQTPNNIAIIFEGQTLTYQQLNERSNQLARYIQKSYREKKNQELKSNTLVVLYLDRSIEMIIGIMAVHKAGGAHVPMDTSYPQDRLDYMLKDTDAEIILSQKHVIEAKRISSSNKIIQIDFSSTIYTIENTSNLQRNSKSADLAYIIYTSGTTGKPKGVMISHENVVRLFFNNKCLFDFNSSDVWTMFHSYCFDFSVWEMYGALLFGGKLVVISKEVAKDTNQFFNIVTDEKVTILNQTPAAFYNFIEVEATCKYEKLSLRYIIFGGEALQPIKLKSWHEKYPQTKLINMYGITETTVHVTYKEITTNEILNNQSNIGKPIPTLTTYLLDDNLNLQPISVAGEICVGGAGVGIGYLKKEALTKERFIDNPHKPGERLYRSGDLARWLPNGELEYLGRKDDQVKIRGYRIELGEIEQAMLQILGIKQSCVLAKDRKTEVGITKYLVGYYVPCSDVDVSQSNIMEKLTRVLPEYMVPASLVEMESFPMTINGKLDKKALPEPNFASSSENYIPPRTDTETQISAIWSEILGLEKVGITDDFFRIGGNSILAIHVSHRMSKALGCEIKVAEIFKYKTIDQLVSHNTWEVQIVIPVTTSQKSPLSFAQERLWFIEQYEQGSNAYHIPVVLELVPHADMQGLKYALRQVVLRHEVLRSTIEQGENQEHGVQIVHDEALVMEDIVLDENADYLSLLRTEINRPFNLSLEYPIRVKFYNIETADGKGTIQRRLLLINMHHIASDGWSMEILQKELLAYYQAYIRNDRAFNLPALEIQYKDFAIWQRGYITDEVLEKQISYWRDKLSGYQTLEMSTDLIRPAELDYRGSSEIFTIERGLSEKLRALCQTNETTLHSLMLSSIAILLGKYTGQKDIVIGSPIANRHYRQTKDLIGFFVNTQVNRILLGKSQSFQELILQVQQDQIDAQQHQDLPFERLLEELEITRDSSRHPIFQIMFGVQNFKGSSGEKSSLTECFKTLESTEFYGIEKFDLSIFIDNSQDALTGQISYATSLFHKETIQRIIVHYQHLLLQLCATPEQPYSHFSLLSAEEYDQIVYQWNNTSRDKSKSNLLDICLSVTDRDPEGIAVVDTQGVYTYGQIGDYSYHIAGYLYDQGLSKPNQLIGILSEKGYQQVVSTLGIIQSVAAYLPLHVDWPIGRIDEVLSEGLVKTVMVSRSEYNDSIKGSEIEDNYKWLIIEDIIEYQPKVKKEQIPSPSLDNIAYVIFTSGSTGKPKGVTISHYGVVNTIVAVNDRFNVNSKDRVLALSELSFDLSVYDIFGILAAGGTVVFPDQEKTKKPEHWFELVEKHRITIWDTVPQLMQLLVDYVNSSNQRLDTLRVVMMSGDWIPVRLPEQIKALNQDTLVMSLGGATEGSIWSIWYEVKKVDPAWKSIPYGQAMPNQKMYVLDEFGKHCPFGVKGEIHIGGDGVALGYWNNEEKTCASFIQHANLGRLYKTGDLGKWNKSGYIEFEGRKDNQVKIRGYRIELGEIEYALLQILGLRQACVLVKERKTEVGNTKYLVGYYVAEAGYKVNQSDIIGNLTQVLPEYMVPASLVKMDSFPITINGKLDKRALPEPDFTSLSENYTAPRTDTETQISKIWGEILGLEKVGITDDFFRLGGDSIMSIQVSGRIRQLGLNCQVKDIFEHRTIVRLVEHLAKKNTIDDIQTEQGILTGTFDLLPIQHWFFEKINNDEFPEANHWNQSFLVKTPELSIDRLEVALEKLVAHHDMLRVCFIKENDNRNWRQVYQMNIEKPIIKTLDVSLYDQSQLHEQLTSWQSGFDLEQGPLFQLGYLYGYMDRSARVYFALHHTIVDAVSWRILADDLKILYQDKTLSKKSSSYRQWVNSVKHYTNEHAHEEEYWHEQLKQLPIWAKSVQVEALSTVEFVEFDTSLTDLLLHHISDAYHTHINDLLLTALSYSLRGINESNIQGITLEGHGREDIDATLDISRTVGWFTVMFPIRLELQETIGKSIQFVKESLRSIPNKGIGFGCFAINEKSELSYHDLSPISFNYLGQFENSEETWQITSEESGNSIHVANTGHNLININGGISNGKLMFSITSRLGQATTNLLAANFKVALVRIVEHCQKQLDAVGSSHTPSDFLHAHLNQQLIDHLDQDARVHQREIQHIYPATSLQQGFIYHVLSEDDDDAYRVQMLYDYRQKLDVDKYLEAWEMCIMQYPILRTAFNWEDEMLQIIYKEGKLHCQLHDISHLTSQSERDATIDSIQAEDRKQPFDLTQPTLLRLHIIKQDNDFYTILNSEHHSIADGWSGPILLTSLHEYYEALVERREVMVREDLAYLQTQEYIFKQKDTVQDYWKRALIAVEDANDINPLLNRPIDLGFYRQVEDPTENTIEIKADAYKKLKDFCTKEGITLNVIVQFAWHKLLQVYSSSYQSIVGTTISGRDLPIEGIENSVGPYINTLPLIIDWDNENSVQDQLQQIQRRLTELNSHSFADLAKMQKQGERLFHSLFVFENYPIPKGNKHIAEISLRKAVEKIDYPLGVLAYEQEGMLTIKLEYDQAYLTKEKAGKHVSTLEYIIEQVIKEPQKPQKEICLLSAEEYNTIVYQWNANEKDYPKNKTIHQLFQEQVERTPDNIAVVYEGHNLTYRELNEKSNQLARHIRAQYQAKTHHVIKADTLIALYLDRSLEMIIGILSILKAGGAYVPMDISYPQERLNFIMEDTEAELILSQKHLSQIKEITLPIQKVLHIDLSNDIYTKEDTSNLPQFCKPTDLAYVIYTSGTTGKPKGVMVEHKGVSNLIQNQIQGFSIETGDKAILFASYVFDATISEVFTVLTKGASLYIIPDTIRHDTSLVSDFIQGQGIEIATLPPVLLSTMPYKTLTKLKTLVVAGETCPIEIMEKWSEGRQLINAYGPTESTVCATMHNYSHGDTNTNIGKPLDNINIYILDPNNNPVPIGVIGELYIGGAGLARGYLKRPDLTEERFVPNPFATKADRENGYTRLYRTGDLVKWLPDGNLEFIGRNDGQVKIHGFRIELGEIEQAMLQIPGVKQSCVLVRERKTKTGNDKYLVNYYVIEHNNDKLSQSTIQSKLSQVLPDYMLPSVLVPMESFPMTINGKLDKRALPEPEFDIDEVYVKPETDLEIRLCQIYTEVLGLESNQISTHQSFFRMGGNSILSIRLKQKLNQLEEFKHVSVADLFKFNSISKLVQSVQQRDQVSYNLRNNLPQNNEHEIAIIGVSGAFSGGSSVADLWQQIANQREGIQFYSKDECGKLGVDESLLEDSRYIPVAGSVKDIELFDPLFWDISPNEAKLLDPQIRKFIEHCWFVLELSGYAHQRKNLNIGVFAGSGQSNYFYNNILNGEMVEQINLWEASVANSKDSLATKTAFFLGLSGLAISINTACSTGLISVVEACKNLRFGICDMALAGGVSLSMPEQVGYVYQEGMINSRDGHCKTFDKEATGTTSGSGVGIVLLKRLGDAIKDKDAILGVIKGYASNNDGDRKTGYIAPSVIGQSECIINAQRMAGVTPDQIDYVECHGTATHLGDPIEIQALREAFEYNQPKGNRSKCKTILGAIKANIGHTDSAAGTAGLIKVCAMLQNNTIPGQVNFCEPNPDLHLDLTNFEIIKDNKEWLPSSVKQRLAGVSSFGVGGTNAHVIIGDYFSSTQELEETIPATEEQGGLTPYVIPISAKSRQSLEQYRQELAKYLDRANEDDQTLNIKDIAYTLQERREHFGYRSACCARSVDELLGKLRSDQSYAEINVENSKIVFMFPGQGAQYVHMAKALYDSEQHFKGFMDQCISIANRHIDVDLFDVMYPGEEVSSYDINETQWAQVSLFTIEYAMAKYLEHLGVTTDAYIGHSIGEYVAATLSGVFTLEDAIKVVIARGLLMQTMQPGSMLAINAREEVVRAIVEECGCEIAVINSSENIVAAGTNEAIKMLKTALVSRSVSTINIATSHAFHSRMMEDAANEFESVFKNIKLKKPTKHFISNLTGEIAKEEVTNPSYWCKQIRNTVQFAKGIENLSIQYNNEVSFVEVGVGKGLSSFVNNYKSANGCKSIQTLHLLPSAKEAKIAEELSSQTKLSKEHLNAKLWMSGIIQLANNRELFKKVKLQTSLPSYQFDYQKCWLEKGKENASGNQLKLLPKEKWLSRPVWSPLLNLNGYYRKDETIFKNALIFLREDQLNSFDFKILAQSFKLIVLDITEYNIDVICTSGQIILNPVNENHFKILGEHLKTKGFVFDAIIHIASVSNVVDIDNALTYSFYSLFLIRQHLLNSTNLKNLLVLTNGLAQITNVDIINPSNGTLVGAIRNINHEFPDIDARVIDIGYDQEGITSSIIQVINNEEYQKSEELLALKFGKLWVERFERINGPITNVCTIEDGDIILITGGLGGIALSIANHISSKHRVKFILVSRKNIYDNKNNPSNLKQKIEIIEKIKANGSSVDIQCADISDKNQLTALINSVEKKYGKITGIIHTEGVANLSTDKYNLLSIKNALKGKVYGIDNIVNTLDIKYLKFLASTSSISSIMGDTNCIDYCASNSYLDYLSVDKKRFKDTKVITINWPRWSDVGMFKEQKFSNEETLKQSQGIQKLMYLNSVNQTEGADLFYQLIMQTNFEQVAVSKLDINKLKNKLFKQEKVKSENKQIAVIESNCTETEYKIAQVFCEVLGVKQISVHDNFFSLGGNSIMAMNVVSLIKNSLNIEVPLSQLFRNPYISGLSSYISHSELYLGEILHGDTVYLLNKEGKKIVFAFPPIVGYGIAFKHLSHFIKDFTLYAFDFIEDENRLSLYVDIILSIQKEGPYILMGYSAGGNLAYEVAVELIGRGYEVSDIIMVDALRRYETYDNSGNENNEQVVNQMIETFMKGYPDYAKNPINFDFIIKKAVRKSNEYTRCLSRMINDKKIRSNIYLILSEENKDENRMADWTLVSENMVEKYQGKGLHVEMLSNPENLMKNSAIINEILSSLALKYIEIEYELKEE